MKLVVLLAVFALWAQAQTEPRYIAGGVVDQTGNPIPRVQISYTGSEFAYNETDGEGKFALQTKAPAIVFRKEGFSSAFVRFSAELPLSNLRVVLATSTGARTLPNCPRGKSLMGTAGGQLYFPKIPSVKQGRQGSDIDYAFRTYSISTRNGPQDIFHAAGPLWSPGSPSVVEVWKLVKYSETYLMAGEWPVIEARGEYPDGKRWRFLGRPFETASYSEVDPASARVLDRVFDGVCYQSAQSR